MANGKLNFAIALNMTTTQFRKGTDVVKKALRGIQYQVLGMVSALGLGTIGLSSLAKEFINVARETNRARVALSNISDGAAGFRKNMTFLTGLAAEYGQELNGVTSSFARFSAASSAVGMGLKDQYKIYSSMTKAITAFGLTSSEAQLTYMALGQMMSKGKVTAEELRRQMGERIPIAMQAMAKAAGGTMQELDNLMKRGEVYSAEVLPKFAEELDKMLGDINTDNIETSLNRLRNSFIAITESLGVGDVYKKLVDGLNSFLSTILQTYQRFAATIAAAILTGKITKAIQKFHGGVAAQEARLLASYERAERQKAVASQNRIKTTQAFRKIDAEWEKADLDQRAAMYASYNRTKGNMDKARAREKAAINNASLEQEKVMLFRSESMWVKAGRGIVTSIRGITASITSMLISFAPALIISLIVNMIMKMRELRKETEANKNMVADYRKEVEAIDGGQEVILLKASLAVLNDKKSTAEEINNAQVRLNSMLGTEIGNQAELNKLVAERINLIQATAKAEFYANKQVEAQNELDTIYRKYDNGEEGLAQVSKGDQKRKGLLNDIFGIKLDSERDTERADALKRVISAAEADLKKAIADGVVLSDGGNNYPPVAPPAGDAGAGAGKASLNDLEKAEQKYSEEMQTLTNQLEAKVISQEEHSKAVDDLNKAIYKEIGGIEGVNAINNQIFKNAKHGVENPLYTEPSAPAYTPPEREERDTLFDYKKSESDKLQEKLKLQEQFVQQLERDIERLGEEGAEAIRMIDEEQQSLSSLSDSLKLAQLKEELEALNKDIFSSGVDGAVNFANALDRIANSWSRLASEDMTGFETVVATLNAMGDTINGLMGIWEAYSSVRELLALKEGAQAAQQTLMTGQAVAAATTEATAASAKSAVVVAGLQAEKAAAAGVMAAKSTAAYASMPFVGVGLAAGQIAAFQGMIAGASAITAGLPGFAKGGIVGGNSRSGDKQLIRANSGEMILTTAQQSSLFKSLKGGSAVGGKSGEVKFVINGKVLEGVLANTRTLRNRQ